METCETVVNKAREVCSAEKARGVVLSQQERYKEGHRAQRVPRVMRVRLEGTQT